MKGLGWLLGALTLALVLGCSGSKNTSALEPSWVATSPVVPGYYVGIGSASKLAHPLDADAVAKQNALDNLSREIRVQVQSTSKTNTLQVNGWLSESFSAQSSSTTNEDLEGFELVDTYSTETEVLAYYRLSKQEHARIQEAKRQAALALALDHLETARSARASASIQSAVDASIRGLDAVRPFLDRPLIHTDNQGRETNVPVELVSMLEGCIAGLSLVAEESEVTLHVADAFQGEVAITALLDGQPAPNVTLAYSYRRGDFPTRGEAVTNASGQATVVLERFEPGVTSTTLEVEVVPTAFVKGLPLMHPFRQAAEGLKSPPIRVDVALAPVALELRVDERAFGKKRDQIVLSPALQQGLQKANVNVVASGADMVLTLQADARPGGSGQGFYTVYVDVVGTVTDAAGKTVFTQTLTKIKGIQLDLPRATDAAYDKASEEISSNFVPALIRLWHGF
jgi:hypothetical protein